MALGTFRLAGWQQGPTGCGQGGLSAYLFSQIVDRAEAQVPTAGDQPLSIRLHAPIPLETDLMVGQDDAGRFTTTAPGAEPGDIDRLILSGAPTEFVSHHPTAIAVADARAARERTIVRLDEHAVPDCFSCGINERSMRVHPGLLDDGRLATDLTPPSWTLTDDGLVEPWVFWAALDCAAGFYAAAIPEERHAVTANYQVKMHRTQIEPETYAVVAFAIGEEWDGRRRWTASAAFDGTGALVAEATSLWIAVED